MNRKKVAVLISGNGGNLQALINACEQPDYPAQIVTVISNKPTAYGLERAKKHNIPAFCIDHKNYTTREDFEAEIQKILVKNNIEIVCLAGFMRLLSASFVNGWKGRILNIHPSLLPLFKGGTAVADALSAGATKTGCTVHHVIPEMDAGEIILQRELAINPEDTVDSLQERIHAQEHIAYPAALKLICDNLLYN